MIGVGLLDRYSYLDVRCDCGCQLFEGVLKANLEGWLGLLCIDIHVGMNEKEEKAKEKIGK